MITLANTRRSRLTAACAGVLFFAATASVVGATTVPPDTEPMGSEPMASEPMGSMPMGSEPMASEPMGSEPMGSAPAYEIPTDLSGEISVSGSSTVEPISAAAAAVFAESNPSVAITVDGPGTGDGFARFCAGETDISDASRPISEEEIAACEAAGIEFIELKVAIDGLSVITSADNTAVECLSFVDLYALLGPDATGITNWADASAAADELAGTVTDLGAVNTPYPDADLTVTAPGEESGTFDSFVELALAPVGEALGVEDVLPRLDYTASPNDSVIIEGIGSNPASLGWVGFAFVEENLDTVRPIPIDGGGGCVEPTTESIASGEYPISRDLFIYVNAGNLEGNDALTGFVDYYVKSAIYTLIGPGEGQVPYVQLSGDDEAATAAVWDARETGTREGEAAEAAPPTTAAP